MIKEGEWLQFEYGYGNPLLIGIDSVGRFSTVIKCKNQDGTYIDNFYSFKPLQQNYGSELGISIETIEDAVDQYDALILKFEELELKNGKPIFTFEIDGRSCEI
jgi:hypothetical protein